MGKDFNQETLKDVWDAYKDAFKDQAEYQTKLQLELAKYGENCRRCQDTFINCVNSLSREIGEVKDKVDEIEKSFTRNGFTSAMKDIPEKVEIRFKCLIDDKFKLFDEKVKVFEKINETSYWKKYVAVAMAVSSIGTIAIILKLLAGGVI